MPFVGMRPPQSLSSVESRKYVRGELVEPRAELPEITRPSTSSGRTESDKNFWGTTLAGWSVTAG
jgi:hypothetical protein